jgi:hypothetical protein
MTVPFAAVHESGIWPYPEVRVDYERVPLVG